MASDASLGRFAGQGSAQNDNFPYNDNVDNAHPAYIDYVLPKNFQRLVSARLSFKLRLYRTYNSLSLTATGGQSANHTHASASHGHTMFEVGGAPGASTNTVWFANGNTNPIVLITPNVGNTSPLVTTATTPGATGTASVDHTHPVSGTATLGVTEGAATTVAAIAFDGVDQTVALGGPWSTDTVELDVTRFTPTTIGMFHTVTITPAGQGRIVSLLRASYYIDSRLAQ